MFLYNLFTLAFAFLVLVSFHELGHYLAAKWAGVKVHKFALGFPPWIFSIKLGETVYAFGITLMGGFVRMQGEEMIVGENEQLDDRDYRKKPIWKRAIIILAGPVFSLMLALPITCYCLWSGLLQAPPIVGAQPDNSRFGAAGLQPGDRILEMDGTPIYHRASMITHLALNNTAHPVQVVAQGLRPGPDGKPVMTRITGTLPAYPDSFEMNNSGSLYRAGLDLPLWQVSVGLQDAGFKFRPVVLALEVPQAVEGKEASPAEKAGLKADDEIVAINGHPLKHHAELMDFLTLHGGLPATLQVRHADKPDQVVDIPIQPKNVAAEGETPDYKIGVRLETIFIVTSVTPDSPAAKAGIHSDMLVELAPKSGAHESFVSATEKNPLDPATGEMYDRPGQQRVATGFADRLQFQFSQRNPGETWYGFKTRPKDQEKAYSATLEVATVPGTLTNELYLPTTIPTAPQPLPALDTAGSGDRFVMFDPRPEYQQVQGLGNLVIATVGSFETDIYRMLQSLKKIVVDLFGGNRKALGGLAGPLGIGGMLWNQGDMQGELAFNHYLMFIGFISINLGIMNLLPIPILDGGHLLMMAIEASRRKPPSRVLIERFQMTGLVIILGLFLLATSMDVYHMIFGR